MKPKIYIWCNRCQPEWHCAMAMAEDGTVLAQHVSSCHRWLRHDMGVERSKWKHEEYDKHYPDGWEIIYLEDEQAVRNCKGLDEACRLNELAGEAAKKWRQREVMSEDG